ncbi:two-component system sensor histidine kinase NreB [Planomicrobium stackebrandtii]|uniref:Sensor histidine kinase n=2 Tax=Planomicrobium stackebrandtii TaxID=253160 RepID=A0ABU0GRH8_9BACL|nr:two-component system sensor histidine kinase NreB [Planomicrobium stackebrandtii]
MISDKKEQLTDLMLKMYENSTEAIFFFTREGQTISMNPAAEKIMNVHVLEQLKKGAENALCTVCIGYTSESDLTTCKDCYFTSSSHEDFSSFQVFLETEGKGITPYAATFHVIDAEKGTRVFILRDLSVQFETQSKLEQNTMMKNVIKAQENERKRISRELHDSVAQELLSAVVDLRALKYMTDDKDVLKKTNESTTTLIRLMDDIRNLSVELRPSALDDFGLEAAFRSHFKRLEESSGLSVDFVSTIERNRYETEVETVFYRICQEAVFNAVKYAHVETVQVRLFEEQNILHLIVKDEGAGFIRGSNPLGTGLGLYGMNERAELVLGNVTISSEIGEGTTVHLRVPLKEQREMAE